MVASEPNMKHKTSQYQSKKDRYIFPGDSCYPISPGRRPRDDNDTESSKEKISISHDDMICRIVNELNPDKTDVAFLTRRHARTYQSAISDERIE